MEKLRRLPTKHKISFGVIFALILTGGIVMLLAFINGKLAMRAEEANPGDIISNKATVSYGTGQNGESNTVSTTIAADTTPPSAPTISTMKISAGCGPIAKMVFLPSTDNVGVSKYVISKNNLPLAEVTHSGAANYSISDYFTRYVPPTTAGANDQMLRGQNNLVYTVNAYDTSNNISPAGTSTQTLSVSSDCSIIQGTSALLITNIAATKKSDTLYTLSWNTSAPAAGQIAYGATNNLGNLKMPSMNNTTNFSVDISLGQPLGTGQNYYFVIAAVTNAGLFNSNVNYSGLKYFNNTGTVKDYNEVIIISKDNLTGTVKDQKTKLPLMGVGIYVREGNTITAMTHTDIQGKYSLNIHPASKHITIIAAMDNYKTENQNKNFAGEILNQDFNLNHQ